MRLQALIYFLILYNSAISQQSLFNAPSSDITTRYKLFVQEQLNFNNQHISNLTLDYGLGKGFEICMNVFQTNFSIKHGHYASSVICINVQKEFILTKRIKTATGIQLGRNDAAIKNGMWIFQNFVYQPRIDGLKLYAGAYYASKYYDGTNLTPGVMCGFDYEISKKLHTMCEKKYAKPSSNGDLRPLAGFISSHLQL